MYKQRNQHEEYIDSHTWRRSAYNSCAASSTPIDEALAPQSVFSRTHLRTPEALTMKSSKLIRCLLLGIASLLVVASCFTGPRNLTVIKFAPPYKGDVEVMMGPTTIPAPAIFTMQYGVSINPGGNFSSTTPDQDQLAEIKRIAAEHGAARINIYCAEPGTVGAGTCSITGYGP